VVRTDSRGRHLSHPAWERPTRLLPAPVRHHCGRPLRMCAGCVSQVPDNTPCIVRDRCFSQWPGRGLIIVKENQVPDRNTRGLRLARKERDSNNAARVCALKVLKRPPQRARELAGERGHGTILGTGIAERKQKRARDRCAGREQRLGERR